MVELNFCRFVIKQNHKHVLFRLLDRIHKQTLQFRSKFCVIERKNHTRSNNMREKVRSHPNRDRGIELSSHERDKEIIHQCDRACDPENVIKGFECEKFRLRVVKDGTEVPACDSSASSH